MVHDAVRAGVLRALDSAQAIVTAAGSDLAGANAAYPRFSADFALLEDELAGLGDAVAAFGEAEHSPSRWSSRRPGS